jgi:hypothetical protein
LYRGSVQSYQGKKFPHIPSQKLKSNNTFEFGAKINVSMMNGLAFLEECSWDAFNEGTRLMSVVEAYKRRLGYYP